MISLRISSRSRIYYTETPVRLAFICSPGNCSNLNLLVSICFIADTTPELTAQLSQEFYNSDLLYLLLLHISRFEFEARKDVVQVFNNLLRRQIGSRWPTVDHIAGRPDIIFAALAGYENEEVALNTGMILKEMLRHEQLCKLLLNSDQYVGYVSPSSLSSPRQPY